MKTRILAIFASIVMVFSGAVAVATPASAHAYVCSKNINAPARTSIQNHIGAVASHACPSNAHHHTAVSVKAELQVWAPNGRGSGTWRKMGTADYDRDYQYAFATPSTFLLYGTNLYRTKAEYVISGPEGSKTHVRTSAARSYTRYRHR